MSETDGNFLRVASYNLSCMSQKSRSTAQARLLSSEKVDIAGLQEINWQNYRFSKNKYNTLDYFKMFPYQFFGEACPFGSGGYGNAIVSQYPISQASNRRYSNGQFGQHHEKELIEAYSSINGDKPETIDYRNALFDKYGLEMVEPRAYQRVKLTFKGRQVAFYNTHLSFESSKLRASQMNQVKKAVLADQLPYKIITGDFNTDTNLTDWNLFKPEFQLVNGHQGVWHDTFVGIDPAVKVNAIDNIIVSSNIEITNVRTVQSTASDHIPLVADLFLK